MKMYEFRFSFYWRFELTKHIGWDHGLAPTSHYLNQWRLVYWGMHASLGLNDLNAIHSTHTVLHSSFLANCHAYTKQIALRRCKLSPFASTYIGVTDKLTFMYQAHAMDYEEMCCRSYLATDTIEYQHTSMISYFIVILV